MILKPVPSGSFLVNDKVIAYIGVIKVMEHFENFNKVSAQFAFL